MDCYTDTFNANGGTLTGGTANWETAAAGKSSVTQPFSKNQSIMTSLAGVKSGASFILWNTKSDGTGETLAQYNKSHNGCQGPVTFYAIYLKSEYYPIAGHLQPDPGGQKFTAPVDGVYRFVLSAGSGGTGQRGGVGGHGAIVTAYATLKAGTTLYVYVPISGTHCVDAGFNSAYTGGSGGGYNGGGRSTGDATSKSNPVVEGGGGAADIRTRGGSAGDPLSYATRILVAGGAGGGGGGKSGGNGQGFSGGGNGRLWMGSPNGGGGYYGGTSRGGGTSYYNPNWFTNPSYTVNSVECDGHVSITLYKRLD